MSEAEMEHLKGARARLVSDRRSAVARLAEPYKGGETEKFREMLISIQKAIDAVDRAYADEWEHLKREIEDAD